MYKNMALGTISTNILLLMLFIQIQITWSHETFVVSFQSHTNGAVSANSREWIEFFTSMSSSKEFTACFWIWTKYFNFNIAVNLWSYCTIEKLGDTMTCLQMRLMNTRKSAHRDVRVEFKMKKANYINHIFTKIDVHSFLHRTWVHFCSSVSTVTEEIKIYYNGNLLGTNTVKKF